MSMNLPPRASMSLAILSRNMPCAEIIVMPIQLTISTHRIRKLMWYADIRASAGRMTAKAFLLSGGASVAATDFLAQPGILFAQAGDLARLLRFILLAPVFQTLRQRRIGLVARGVRIAPF